MEHTTFPNIEDADSHQHPQRSADDDHFLTYWPPAPQPAPHTWRIDANVPTNCVLFCAILFELHLHYSACTQLVKLVIIRT